MVNIKSSLGAYLRWDREDWTKERWNAATFDTHESADVWIVDNFGRNGLRFFSPASVPQRDYDGAE